MSFLRRSGRINKYNNTSTLCKKAIQIITKNIQLLNSNCLMLTLEDKCKRLTKIYHLFSFYFYNIVIYSDINSNKLFYGAYNHSFRLLSEINSENEKGAPVNSIYLQMIKKKIFIYRRQYEVYREKQWSTELWVIELPNDILNIISSYVF
jgi:hypothetical protein